MDVIASIKAKLPAVKAAVVKAETWVKTVVVAAATGAAADGLAVLHSGKDLLFTPAGIVQLKHTFIGGAVVSVIGLFTKSPIAAQQTKQQ